MSEQMQTMVLTLGAGFILAMAFSSVLYKPKSENAFVIGAALQIIGWFLIVAASLGIGMLTK